MASFKQRLERLERLVKFREMSEAKQMKQFDTWRKQLKDIVVVQIDDLEALLAHRDSYSIRPWNDESRERLQAALAAAKARRAADHG